MAQLRQALSGLERAQRVDGQDPKELAARSQKIGELQWELDERQRKHQKYGEWRK